MTEDIDSLVSTCQACQALRPSNDSARITPSNPATFAMEALGTDIFHCGGKDWLVIVDRYSGFPFVRPLPSMTTAAVIRALEKILWEFGLPNYIRSDGGPQFASAEFRQFLQDLDIRHEISSPYNPSSNGLAEAAVKQVKYLMLKCAQENSRYDPALHAYRCTARADGHSPFDMFFGRTGKSLLPALTQTLGPIDAPAAAAARQNAREKWAAAAADRRRRCIYFANDLVHVQDPISLRWSPGKVLQQNGVHSYDIEFESGSVKTRNEKFLRLRKSRGVPHLSDSADSNDQVLSSRTDHDTRPVSPFPDSPSIPLPIPRRSPRLAASSKSVSAVPIISDPTMFGFSPYVSPNTLSQPDPRPFTGDSPSSIAAVTKSPPWTPPPSSRLPALPLTLPSPPSQPLPTPPSPLTPSLTPSQDPKLLRQRAVTSRLRLTADQSGSPSTTRRWGSPSGQSLPSSSCSSSSGRVSNHVSAAYSTAVFCANPLPAEPLPPRSPRGPRVSSHGTTYRACRTTHHPPPQCPPFTATPSAPPLTQRGHLPARLTPSRWTHPPGRTGPATAPPPASAGCFSTPAGTPPDTSPVSPRLPMTMAELNDY